MKKESFQKMKSRIPMTLISAIFFASLVSVIFSCASRWEKTNTSDSAGDPVAMERGMELPEMPGGNRPPGPPPEGMAGPGAPPDGSPPEGFTPGGMPQGVMEEPDHGEYAFLVEEDLADREFSSSNDRENALRVQGNRSITLRNLTISKTAGEAGAGESSNFYGSNAAFLALDGADVTLQDSQVFSSTQGGNGIFSYGEGTIVRVSDTTIRTSGNSSGGVMVTGGGTMEVRDSDIETWGDSSAPLRTDRGGGVLTVAGGTFISHGTGSPAVYSTAEISVSNAVLTSTSSEAIVVEGKNSVHLENCDVTGNMQKENVENLQNVMIYQSMSGDAAQGKGSFTMKGGTLKSNSGDMFYITNTSSSLYLENVDLTLSNATVLKVAGNDARNGWGKIGSNGADCDFEAVNQILKGNILVDEISCANITLKNHSRFSGSVNPEGQAGSVSIILDETSIWVLTADSWISSFEGNPDNIDTNGYALYVAGRKV